MKIRLFTIVFLSITLVGLSQNIDSSFQIQLINNLLDSAGTLIEKENPKEALQIIQKVEPLILPLLGPNSMEYARLSQTYGQYYENDGDFAKAEHRFKASLKFTKG
ncbi:MAG: tetratricopeptide repeat protein [Saprospiraceae bacterium]|nr:tetratricopeptide repeat protein [Candidatus Vicinibacter affinis]